jgi:hypothetical protein
MSDHNLLPLRHIRTVRHTDTICVCWSYSRVTNDEHPGHAHFECQSGHWLSWLRFSLVFHITTRCFKLGNDIEALCHKPESRRFGSWWGHWFFYSLNPSGCSMALGSYHPLTEMSTRDISGGWMRPVCGADNLTTFMCWMSRNCGSLNLLEP